MGDSCYEDKRSKDSVSIKTQMKFTLVSKGSGMVAGLEMWKITRSAGSCIVLVDRSPDGRFAADVTQWNSAVSLNAATLKKLKDAAEK